MSNMRVRQWQDTRLEALSDALPRWAAYRVMELLVELARAECAELGDEDLTVAALQNAAKAVTDGLV